ncbi:MAG: carboxynorspermidine decarboxylase [Oscillospiraceae bacterium]
MVNFKISCEKQKALQALKTPCYVIDLDILEENLKILNYVEKQSGCKILLAQKAFSAYKTYPLIGKYLSGVTSSGLFESRLGFEEMKKVSIDKEVHTFAPAFKKTEFEQIAKYSNHIVFNSINQWQMFKEIAKSNGVSCGVRINPQYSEIETEIYNPCISGSRFGIKAEDFDFEKLAGIEGIHFHTMCEQGADTLERTIKVVEEKFGQYFYALKWINFGGGHHITKNDYDVEKLIKCIKHIKEKYNLKVYLEPGEAIALNAGWLVTSVLDFVKNDINIAIVDASAACHMPDVLEMPYRPYIINSGEFDKKEFKYRLGGPTCLAGDVIGDYSFDAPLNQDDKLIFCDMAIYSMVKNNTFNGIALPQIATIKSEKNSVHTQIINNFSYADFKCRL